jgi:hypothetical protein
MQRAKHPLSSPIFSTFRNFLASQNYPAIFVVVFLVVLIRLPIDFKRIMQAADGDFGNHIYFALDLLHGRPVAAFTLAHSFWQYLLIGVWWISRCRIDFWQSAIAFQVLSSLASALILYFWFGLIPGRPSGWIRAFWAVTLVIVTPIILPFLLDGKYYYGYIVLANYHNPTVHMLRPFALLMFIIALQVLDSPRHSVWLILFSAAVTAAATFLKPNYTLLLLPALGGMVAYGMAKRQSIDWRLLVFGLGLPAVLTLGAQYLITYVNGEPGDKIALLPFVVVSLTSDFVLLKFILSILFPLAIAILYWKWARQDREMIFAWAGFGIGALQYYLLAETGDRLAHGNFSWGLQIGLFILFVVSIRFLLKQQYSFRRLVSPSTWLQYAFYTPHVLAGLLYYFYCFTTPHYV